MSDLDPGGFHTIDGLAQCPRCGTYNRVWTHDDVDHRWCLEPGCEYDTRTPTLFENSNQ